MRKSLLVTLIALLALSACGGASGDPQSAEGDQAPQSQQDQQGQAGQQGQPNGASGEIAAIDGTTLQVQNETDGQVAVTYSDATTFTAQVTASAADLQVGACVTVMPADPSSEDTTSVAAGAVSIVAAVDGACSGFGGPGGMASGPGGPGGGPGGGQLPDGGTPPTDRPDMGDMGDGQGGQGGQDGQGGQRPQALRASGKVTAVSAAGFTVEPTARGEEEAPDPVTVTVSDATTWTKTVASDTTSLAVGKCVFAQGDHDSTGTVTATSIQVSEPVDGECASGFTRRFGQGQGQGQGQQEGEIQS